jgi:hypothetical protein
LGPPPQLLSVCAQGAISIGLGYLPEIDKV